MRKLFILFSVLFISLISYSKDIVVTSIQPLYSLTKYVTENTDIEVVSIVGSDVSMETIRDALEEKNFDFSIGKNTKAVIDISRVWPEDTIFEKIRGENIRVIEIDASYPFDSKKSALFIDYYKNGRVNPYVWLNSKNLIKMANIIADDLITIFPKNKKQIEKNIVNFTTKIIKLDENINSKLMELDSLEVIYLSENLSYLINDFNLYGEYVDYKEVNAQNIDSIMKNHGIKSIVSDRWVKKDVLKALEESGGKFVVLNTLNIPMDLNDKMDPDAILKSYLENIDNLVKILK